MKVSGTLTGCSSRTCCPGSAVLDAVEWGRGAGGLTGDFESRVALVSRAARGSFDIEGYYQVLLRARRAHKGRKSSFKSCVHECSQASILEIGDLLMVMAAGLAKSYARNTLPDEVEALEDHMLSRVCEVFDNYDVKKSPRFIPYLVSYLERSWADMPIVSDFGAQSRKVAIMAHGRGRGLESELGRPATSKEVFESTRDWAVASRVLKDRGDSATRIDLTAQIADVLTGASKEEIRLAHKRLSRDSVMGWLKDLPTFISAVGFGGAAPSLDESVGDESDSGSKTLAEMLLASCDGGFEATEEEANIARVNGLATGKTGEMSLAIVMKLQDTGRHQSYESIGDGFGIEDVASIKEGVRDALSRVTCPLTQYAWLVPDLNKQVVLDFVPQAAPEFLDVEHMGYAELGAQ